MAHPREGASQVIRQPMVQCRVCGIARRQLGRHIQAAHGMSVANYLVEFPGALVDAPGSRKRSTACRTKQAAAARRRWASPVERAAQSKRLKASAPWTGKKLSDTHRKAISQGCRGKHKRNPDLLVEGVSQDRSRPHGGQKVAGQRKGIPHPCRTLVEANFARVLLQEGVPYEYAPEVFGLHWVPAFRLMRPLWDLIPDGWVEVVGWRERTGFLPRPLVERISEFQGKTGEQVTMVCQNSTLWKAIESIYASQIPLWEKSRRNLRTHPLIFGQA